MPSYSVSSRKTYARDVTIPHTEVFGIGSEFVGEIEKRLKGNDENLSLEKKVD